MTYRVSRFGWLKDAPDYRDYKPDHAGIAARMERILPVVSRGAVPRNSNTPVGALRADLRPWCSPIEDQGNIGSCTANAAVGALEYFERKTRGEHVDASRLFLYRVTRRFLGWEGRGDTGAFLRSTIKALRLFGTVPEKYWPYDEKRWDAEPEAFHYAYAQNFKALEYFRLDPSIGQIKSALANGLPVVFGFTCFESLDASSVGETGIIPFPGPREATTGGHAVLAVGYTDSHVLIRNSWGKGWGEKGYGYLPWTYFDESHPLADDFWAVTNAAFVPDNEADEDVRKRRRIPVSALRSPGEPGRTPQSQPTVAEEIVPAIKVRRGTDPIRAVPLRFHSTGLRASPDHAPVVLPSTPGTVSLTLKSLTLKEAFDFLWWKEVKHLYCCAIAWDLSGNPPSVFPPKEVENLKGVYDAAKGDRVSFVGDGLRIWGPSPVKGALYVRLLVMQNEDEARTIGARLEEVRSAVAGSPLATALGPLATAATGIPGATLTAIGIAANEITKIVANLLARTNDKLVAVFDGSYGADHALTSRIEPYEQRGAAIELEITA